MKRIALLLLCLMMLLALAACGGGGAPAPTEAPTAAPEPTAEPTAEPAPEAEEAPEADAAFASNTAGQQEDATATDAATEPEPLPELSDPALDEARYEAAQACVGRSVEELYAAIGEPTGGAQYAASCSEENAQDGMLHYEGFYVWTVKNDSGETVHEVYLSQ